MSRTVNVDLTLDGTCICNDATTLNSLLTTSSIKIKRVTKNTNYTVLSTDYLIGADVSSSTITITLPTASTVPNQIFHIVDEKGNSLTNNIIVSTQEGDTIIGNNTLIIASNYTSITVYSDGTSEYLVV